MSRFYPVSQPSVTQKEIDYVNDAVRSGWISSLGKYIELFEESFARFCQVKYALTTSNGTTGLHLALEALGIGKGQEVIIPDLTFVATANAVAYTGATPVLVDIEPDTLCISPNEIRKAITSRTRAIMPVHLYGHPADMDAIHQVAKEFNLIVIEDAAEAHGALYHGKRVGGLSDCGVFSFYGNKIITTGEGGMLTTNNYDFYRRAKSLRDHAMSPEKRYWHPERGFNYRITNIQAALGLAQLERIDEIIQHRDNLMSWYQEFTKTSESVRLNYVDSGVKSAFWMICLEIDWLDYELRLKLMDSLKKQGVDSRPYFYPVSSMPMYAGTQSPISLKKSQIGLNLPSYFDLTRDDVSQICAILNSQIHELRPKEITQY